MDKIEMEMTSPFFSTKTYSSSTTHSLLHYLKFGLIVLIVHVLVALSKDNEILSILTTPRQSISTGGGLYTYD